MKFKTILPLFLLLIILLPIQQANSLTQHIGYTASSLGGSTCGTNCYDIGDSSGQTTNGKGMALKAPLTGQLQSVDVYIGASTLNQLVLMTFNLGGNPSSTSFSCSGGNTCYENSGQGWTVQQVQTVSGLTLQSFNTINLPSPLSVTINQWIAIVYMDTTGDASAELMFCGSGASPGCGTPSGQPTSFMNIFFQFGSTSPSGSFNSASKQFDTIIGGTFADVATGGQIQAQCYGNCGNPATTFVNTNSTSGLNFNNSITIFYQAQSNLNGRIRNITAVMAKSYSIPLTIFTGLYTVDSSCTATNNPFTVQCPGILQTFTSGFTFPAKGKNTLNWDIPISAGQWFGIAFSASFTASYPNAVYLNDTNTAVTMYQTSGIMPGIITNFSTLSINKPALYSYILGAGIIVTPPTIPPTDCLSLSCQILQIIDNFGAGRLAGGLFWMMIWWGFITFGLVYISSPSNSEGTKQFGESFLPGQVHLLTLLVFTLFMTSIGALPIWVPILIAFIVFLMVASMISGFLSGRGIG